jgi:MoaA/NifB/PqqE/SkfB family radical SAM enzyme
MFKTIWIHKDLELARAQSVAGKQLSMCNRCWSEEKCGHTSEREYLTRDLPMGLDYTDPNYYLKGPRHLNIKVSNICNLRCRTCQSYDSYLYHIEGEYYEKKNNLTDTLYTKEQIKKQFTDAQLDELYEFSSNLERIELYGGEPFLDDQIPKFLTRLVDNGLSKNMELFVSTNATHELTDIWRNILTNFKQVIINVSIDGIGKRFTYMRHPGKWPVAQQNIDTFFKLTEQHNSINVIPVITVSALNVWYLDEVFDYFKQYDVEPFIIMAQTPDYYCVNVLPKKIKKLVEEKLKQLNNPKFDAIIKLMYTPIRFKSFTFKRAGWKEFKFWTKEKDAYRNENYIDTFEEFGQLLIKYNEWK